jgi:hypothetical protein
MIPGPLVVAGGLGVICDIRGVGEAGLAAGPTAPLHL